MTTTATAQTTHPAMTRSYVTSLSTYDGINIGDQVRHISSPEIGTVAKIEREPLAGVSYIVDYPAPYAFGGFITRRLYAGTVTRA